MNVNKIKGISLVVVGSVQGGVARLVGNHQLGFAAHSKVIEGHAAFAVGDAQDIIKRCLRRSAHSHRGVGQAH